MNLRLVVPALFDFPGQVPLPAGLRGLRRATLRQWPAATLEEWLCQLFGLTDCPVAALTAAVDTPEHTAAAWLRADPVHLALGQNSVGVVAGPGLQLAPNEARELAAAIEPLLDTVKARLVPATAERWYLQLDQQPGCRFLPLPRAIGRPLPAALIEGEQAGAWKRLVAEIQMTLHQHPVNEAREQRGLPAINHLWLWGQGAVGPLSPPAATVRGDHLLLQGLARAAALPVQPAPATFARWRAQATGVEHIVLLDSLLECARAGDVHGWHTARNSLVDDWLQPAIDSGLARVECIVPDLEHTRHFSLGRFDRWCLWKNTHVDA